VIKPKQAAVILMLSQTLNFSISTSSNFMSAFHESLLKMKRNGVQLLKQFS